MLNHGLIRYFYWARAHFGSPWGCTWTSFTKKARADDPSWEASATQISDANQLAARVHEKHCVEVNQMTDDTKKLSISRNPPPLPCVVNKQDTPELTPTVTNTSFQILLPTRHSTDTSLPPKREGIGEAIARSLLRNPKLPSVGKRFGRFRILGVLGHGGMGRVYSALDENSAQTLALKVVSFAGYSAKFRQQCLREARMATLVKHPRSLLVYGVEEIEGTSVILMELLEGETLSEKLKKKGHLTDIEVLPIVVDLIEGLEAAFQAGVLHRDIKPSNCFIDPVGRAKIGDFGISIPTRHEFGQSEKPSTAGTPAYAAPEQMAGLPTDIRADIYSLGATLYHLLTGRPPFPTNGAPSQSQPQGARRVVWKAEETRRLPRRLRRAVERCLEWQPQHRFQNYQQLLSALDPNHGLLVEPASRNRRVVAFWIDSLLVGFFFAPLAALAGLLSLVSGELSAIFLFLVSLASLLFLGLGIPIYFALGEFILGTTLGKWAMGLRVQAKPGGHPRFRHLLLRTFIFWTVYLCSIVACMVAGEVLASELNGRMRIDAEELVLSISLVCANIVAGMVLFGVKLFAGKGIVTGRHDSWSKTQVVYVRKPMPRAGVSETPEANGATPPELGSLAKDDISSGALTRLVDKSGPVSIGWHILKDDELDRIVWARVAVVGEGLSSELRRRANRKTRARWIGQSATQSQVWDLFEGSEGSRHDKSKDRKTSWGDCLPLIKDLAVELCASEVEETLPTPLQLDQIWIASTGQLMLLDSPWDPNDPTAPNTHSMPMNARQLLVEFMTECRRRDTELRIRSPGSSTPPWPVVSMEIEAKIRDGSAWESIRALLARSAVEKHVLTTRDRVGLAITSSGIPMTLLAIVLAVENTGTLPSERWSQFFVYVYSGLWLLPSTIVSLVGKLDNCAMHGRRIAVVDVYGFPAGRMQKLVRTLFANEIWILLVVCCALGQMFGMGRNSLTSMVSIGWILLLILGIVFAFMSRSPADRIAGTWLVPRRDQ